MTTKLTSRLFRWVTKSGKRVTKFRIEVSLAEDRAALLLAHHMVDADDLTSPKAVKDALREAYTHPATMDSFLGLSCDDIDEDDEEAIEARIQPIADALADLA